VTKVLWLIKGLGPGGAEQLLVTHAHFGDHEAFDYRAVYLVGYKDHLVPALEEQGVGVTYLPGERPWQLGWLRKLRKMIRTERIDVIHSHSPLPASLVRMMVRTIPRAERPKLVYTEHNEWGKHRPATRALNRTTIAMEDEIVAVAEAVRSSMSPRFQPRVRVIHHGIDVDAVRAQADREGVREELGIGADEFVIGTVANLRWEKAYDILLEAAAQVTAERRDVRFVSVGQGPLEAKIAEQHEQLGLGDRFLLLGYRSDAVRVMSGFDLFCLASRHEGLPVALMEALAFDLPAVVTSVGGMSELLGEGAEPILPDSSEALAKELLNSVEGRPAAVANVDGSRAVVELEALYRGRTRS
jgi:glycosyltransferase involved in cell wall biosynthesis